LTGSAIPAWRFTVGPLGADDLARCAELERELFPEDDPWRESMFAAELAAGHYYRAARTGEGTLVGYAGLAQTAGPPAAEAQVHTIGVDRRWQRRGLGRLLLRDLLAMADHWQATTFLEVRTDNDAAIGLYRGEGFEIVGRRRRYYWPSQADAYIMRRPPAPGAQPARAGAGAGAGVCNSTARADDTATRRDDTATSADDTAGCGGLV
jgi:ribosomal-protein-alanine N-acetyltransferase